MARQCIVCGVEIPEGRLKLLPETKHCVQHSDTAAYAVRRTYSGTSVDDVESGIQIFRDPRAAEDFDRVDNLKD